MSYHPRAKQLPAARLYAAALNQIYGVTEQQWLMPSVASAVGSVAGGVMRVDVTLTATNGEPLVLKDLPYESTQVCPTQGGVAPSMCAWPTIVASNGAQLNATLALSADSLGLVFTAPAPAGATPTNVLYAWGTWPVVTVYSSYNVTTKYETFDFPLMGFNVPVTAA